MKVFWSVDDVKDEMADGVVAIGNFDGVHLGHVALIAKVNELKGQRPGAVLSFTPHPNELLHENVAHFYLTSDEQKIRMLSRLGLDFAIIQRIDPQFLKLSPVSFVEEVLVNQLKAKDVVVGDDFTFGAQAKGNTAFLTKLGGQHGFNTHVVPPVNIDGQRCSSTTIRSYLRAGDVAKANRMLGRQFSMRGEVLAGQSKGASLGFKTANLLPAAGFGLCRGVYATVTRVLYDHGFLDYVSATNVGVRPTVTEQNVLVVESHCLDGNLDLYGQTIEVFFVARLRDEMKFPTVTALQEQVQRDFQALRQMHLATPSLFQVAG